MLYGTSVRQLNNISKMKVAELIIIRWVSGNTLNDGIKNEIIRAKSGLASIEDKMRENRLNLSFSFHVHRRPVDVTLEELIIRGHSYF